MFQDIDIVAKEGAKATESLKKKKLMYRILIPAAALIFSLLLIVLVMPE